MHDILNQTEIDELLAQIKEELLEKKITKMKPSEINIEPDKKERERLNRIYKDLKFVYIRPLQKLLDYYYSQVNIKGYKLDLSELSIQDGIIALRKQLLSLGYTTNQLVDLVPKTVDEVQTIIDAKCKGFEDNQLVSNRERLASATNYLMNYSHKTR